MDLTHQRRSNLSPEDFAPSSSHGHERHGHERKGTRSRVPQPAHPTTVLKAPTARPIPAWGVAPCTAAPQTRGLKTRAILAWAEGPGATTPHIRGLKARATLAWGNAPGTQTQTICGLKARAIESSIQSVSAPGSALHEMVRRPAANPLIELPEAE